MLINPEFSLVFLLLLNAFVLYSAWKMSGRWTDSILQRLIDMMLIWYGVQYIAVALPGLFGWLNGWSMSAVGISLSCGMYWFSRGVTIVPLAYGLDKSPPRKDSIEIRRNYSFWIVAAMGIFVLAYSGCIVWMQGDMPLIDSDGMTYHIPAAAHWLQTGRISILPMWFFNPANSYSPLAGSMFITWLLAPMQSDILARAAQYPAVFLLFLATFQLGRLCRLPDYLAAIMAGACGVSRPYISELLSGRDDVFLSAFVIVAIAAGYQQMYADTETDNREPRDSFNSIRLGMAIGLTAATKITFLFSAPAFLLLIGNPRLLLNRWKHWCIAAGTAFVIAGPWYIRNIILTGNPIYPVEVSVFGKRILSGLFEPKTSERLSTWTGIREATIYSFHAPSSPLLISMLGLGAIALLISTFCVRRFSGGRTSSFAAKSVEGRRGSPPSIKPRVATKPLQDQPSENQSMDDPLLRTILFGFPICLMLFLWKAPYAELRFIFPVYPLLFVAAGVGVNRWCKNQWAAGGIGLLFFAEAFRNSFRNEVILLQIGIQSLVITLLVLTCILLDQYFSISRSRNRAYAAALGSFLLGMMIYVDFNSYIRAVSFARNGGNTVGDSRTSWHRYYPASAGAWDYVEKNVPQNATIAYSNTCFLMPLQGEQFKRRAIYIPVRKDIDNFLQLPRAVEKSDITKTAHISGESIDSTFASMLNEQPDYDIWRKRLLASSATYLLVMIPDPKHRPPEIEFASRDANVFLKVFEDEGAIVFQVRR